MSGALRAGDVKIIYINLRGASHSCGVGWVGFIADLGIIAILRNLECSLLDVLLE